MSWKHVNAETEQQIIIIYDQILQHWYCNILGMATWTFTKY